VCYKEGALIVVRVEARVLEPKNGTAHTTTTFYMTFRKDAPSSTPGESVLSL
jgi:hypothetical protein